MGLEQKIEAVLFYKSEPLKKSALAELLSVSQEELEVGLNSLTSSLSTRGLRIITTDTSVQLATAPEASELIESIRKDELRGDIGKAGAETLAIILYRGPLSRVDVDRIRGVNSTFIIRNLLIRGLVERRPHPTDTRQYLYAATPELFAHLGITNRESLADFSEVMNAIDSFEKETVEEQTESEFTQSLHNE